MGGGQLRPCTLSQLNEEYMRGIKLSILILLALALSAPVIPQTSKATASAVTQRGSEVRALWVVRTTLTSPDKIHKMLESASAAGFNTLIVQVRGRGDAYYNSRWEPRAVELKDQSADFDPLGFTIAEAHRRGLKVHAWLNTSLLANLDALPDNPQHVFNRHPEWLAVPHAVASDLYEMSPQDPAYRARIVEWSKANRGELEGVFQAELQPKPAQLVEVLGRFQYRQLHLPEHIYRIWMDILKKYPVDGMHFDYVRLASPDFDFSRTSLKAFLKWLNPRLTTAQRALLKQSLKTNPLAATDAYKDKFGDFQREQITQLVARIYREVKKRRPEVIVSAAVFANDENAYTHRSQDWRRWLKLGILDVACPMAYTTDTAVFRQQIEVANTAAHPAGKRVWAGIGAYRISVESTVDKINVARALGADGVILFSYDFTAIVGPLNPQGDYLQRVRMSAFESPAVPK